MHASPIFAAAALGLACTAWAADKGPLLNAAKLDGTKVFDSQGKQIGKLDDVLVEPASGIIRYGVVQVDKTWNLNDPEIAVPWTAFTVNKPGDIDMSFSLDATKEKLESAPRYKDSDADRIFSRDASKPIYDYWSIYWFEMPGFPEATPPSKTTSPAKPDTASPDREY
jgi:sporulation protein YlmC with PRC-barrel domain